MSAPDSNIRAAFVTRLQAFPALPPVAWENIAYTPVTGTTYLRPYLLPAEPFQAEIGSNGQNRHTGIYQINIFAPAGCGTATVNTLRDALINHFKRGTVLTYSGISVTCEKAFAGPMPTETDWVRIPITVRYRAYASN